jgi:hypothetical protein
METIRICESGAAMGKGFKEFFLAERGRALAIVYLTRREDLRIEAAKEELGLDFLVYIVKEEEPSQRPFGVLLRAEMAPVDPERANALLRPSVSNFRNLGTFPYPVCLFLLTMRDDRGYYTWLLEPLINGQGKPRLRERSEADCKPLDKEGIDEIVATVDRWYDALYDDLKT